MTKAFVVAIDGLAGAGKSTTARLVAARLGYKHLDTGAMYRVVTLAAKRADVKSNDQCQLKLLLEKIKIELLYLLDRPVILLDGEDVSEPIRHPEISRFVGDFADQPMVRNFLVARQRELGLQGGVVAEGRDMASVVFPSAEIKVRLVADLEVRTRRRHAELLAKGINSEYIQVREDIVRRDHEDAKRDYGVVTKTDRIVEIDTSDLSVDEQVELIAGLVAECQ